jgi:hypothetical protein
MMQPMRTGGHIYAGDTVPGVTLTGQRGGRVVRKLERVQ